MNGNSRMTRSVTGQRVDAIGANLLGTFNLEAP